MPGPRVYGCTPSAVELQGRGLVPLRGVGDAAPYRHNPQGFSLPQTGTAAWGQAALHPLQIPQPKQKSRGEHFVRPGGLTSSES